MLGKVPLQASHALLNAKTLLQAVGLPRKRIALANGKSAPHVLLLKRETSRQRLLDGCL